MNIEESATVTNGELYRILERMEKRSEAHGVKLELIQTQTTITNGRVSNAERDIKALKAWQSRVGWLFPMALISIAVAVATWFITR